MIRAEDIYKATDNIVSKYKTRDPEEIAEYLDISVFENEFEKLLGMYTSMDGHRIVILNSLMSPEMRRMVLAHEIGHDILHHDAALGFKEFSMVCKTGTTEYEANAFCAHLLIPDEIFFESIEEGKTVDTIAAECEVDPNIVLIKGRELHKMGHDIKNCDIYDSCFFKTKAPF